MTNPQLYKKKPLPVMAYLWDGAAFSPSHVPPGTVHSIYELPSGQRGGHINTREGVLTIFAGEHYIVGPGAEGEFWPVKKSIFEATYEQA
jgi:hypothetical protein